MPLDPSSGVFYELHGQGRPLLVGLPLMASFDAIFGPELRPVLDGYLDRLTDGYRVLRVDYPSIGGSADIAPEALTAQRVCADLLAVASAAGFDRFAYWGHSWGGAVGLELAARSDRLSALVVGGWPPLDPPTASLLQAIHLKQDNPEPSSMKVLRSKDQYRQWASFYASALEGHDGDRAARASIPKMVLYGADGDLVEAGMPVDIASRIRRSRSRLLTEGWRVHEIAGQGHGVCMQPELVVPPVRRFLDEVLS